MGWVERWRGTEGGGQSTEGGQLFVSYRDVLGAAVLVGDVTVAVGAAFALRAHAPLGALIAWAAVVVATSYGWELVQRWFPSSADDDEQVRDRWGWLSTLAWGALPWLVITEVDQGEVAWILVFMVVFGLATDLLYEAPTDAPSLNAMLITYGGSYIVAFAIHLQGFQIGAVLIAGGAFYIGSRIWQEVNDALVQRRVRSEEEARTDTVTGLGTRVTATEAIDTMIAAGHPTMHCAFIDIDDFKHLNDNHGYALGDAALRAIGTRLREFLPESWTLARFGGDEFVAVGPNEVDFHEIIETTVTLAGVDSFEISQSLSIGVTTLPANTSNADELFLEAAAALRYAKRLGKHQVLTMTDELRSADEHRTQLGGRAGAALDAGEIVPWAQTIVEVDTGSPRGLELLARWVLPDGSIVPPDQFIPVIEDQGRGPALGILMITHAVKTLSQPELRNRNAFVSVNISARHLYHRRLPSEILALLGQFNVEPSRLVLEITESQHLPSSPIWRETAHQLRTLGIGLAMDDLGAGYASVQQLFDVPFSHVKVDRVLTEALKRPGTSELASAIASIAEGAGMTAIVEGIETEDQRRTLAEAGYPFAQGFLFHRPEPLALAVETLLETRARSDDRA